MIKLALVFSEPMVSISIISNIFRKTIMGSLNQEKLILGN